MKKASSNIKIKQQVKIILVHVLTYFGSLTATGIELIDSIAFSSRHAIENSVCLRVQKAIGGPSMLTVGRRERGLQRLGSELNIQSQHLAIAAIKY